MIEVETVPCRICGNETGIESGAVSPEWYLCPMCIEDKEEFLAGRE